MEAPWTPVMALAELRQGMTEVELGGAAVLLVRRGDLVHACATACPHKFTPLAGGELADGRLTCPLHHAVFDLASGRPFPGSEFAGNLPLYPVRVSDGVVEVRFP